MSHKMGKDEALARLKTALADSCPAADWNSVWSRYQEISDAEAAEIRAKMAEEEAEEEDEDDAEAEPEKEAEEAKEDGDKAEEASQVADTLDATPAGQPYA